MTKNVNSCKNKKLNEKIMLVFECSVTMNLNSICRCGFNFVSYSECPNTRNLTASSIVDWSYT